MIKNNQNRKKVVILASLAVVALVVSGLLIYIYAFNGTILGWSATKMSENVNYDPPSRDEVTAGQNEKNDTIADDSKDSDNADLSKTPQNSTNDTSTPTVATDITITSKNQYDNVLQVRTLISKVSNNGTCVVKLIRGTEIGYTTTASTQALANSSTCKGFDIPLSGVARGVWTLSVEFTEGTVKGSTSEEVTIQ